MRGPTGDLNWPFDSSLNPQKASQFDYEIRTSAPVSQEPDIFGPETLFQSGKQFRGWIMNYEKIEELREIKIHQRLKWVKPKSLQNANVVSQKSRGTTPLHFGDDDNTVSWSEINIIFSWRGELSLLYLSKPRKKKKAHLKPERAWMGIRCQMTAMWQCMYLEGVVEPLVYKKATHGTVSGTLLFCTLWMVGQRHFDPGGKEQRTHLSSRGLGKFLGYAVHVGCRSI